MQLSLPVQLEKATEMLMSHLPKRSQTVLERRFGLRSGKRATLDAIGKTYNITRERVRQIEADCFNKMRKSESYKKLDHVFDALTDFVQKSGGMLAEHTLIRRIADEGSKAHAQFLLTVTNRLKRATENDHFHHRWYADEAAARAVEKALTATAEEVRLGDRVYGKEELMAVLARHLASAGGVQVAPEVLATYLESSKVLASNAFGEWGIGSSSLINPRGMRDMAYLILKRAGQPLHFLETARRISNEITKRPVHAQTVHNELIKDKRFVLVGRGTYGLEEWGYEPGVVRDVIAKVLEESPLSKEEVAKRVLRMRQVKENTVVINLQNKRYFKKLPDGRYTNIV